jgi:hypothetical protein
MQTGSGEPDLGQVSPRSISVKDQVAACLNSSPRFRTNHHDLAYDGRTIYFSRFDEGGIWSVPVQGGADTVVVGRPGAAQMSIPPDE